MIYYHTPILLKLAGSVLAHFVFLSQLAFHPNHLLFPSLDFILEHELTIPLSPVNRYKKSNFPRKKILFFLNEMKVSVLVVLLCTI